MAKKPTVCGVDVLTWGIQTEDNLEELFYLNNLLFGSAGIGHAAITLTIPRNQKSEQLIKTYCSDKDDPAIQIIPFQRKTVTFANGKTEAVYVIYFSIWPSGDESFLLVDNHEEDSINTFTASNFAWTKNLHDINTKERIRHGIIFDTLYSPGPFTVSHQRHFATNSVPLTILNLVTENTEITNKINDLNALKDTLTNKLATKNLKLTRSDKRFLSNMLDTDASKYLSKSNLLTTDLQELIKTIDDSLAALTEKFSNNKNTIESATANPEHLTAINYGNQANFLTIGAVPATVHIPINNTLDDMIGTTNGLDPEAMLKKMHQIATSETAFNLYRENCSFSAAHILEAGAVNPYLKQIATQKSRFAINTPQSVYNSAVEMQEVIITNKQPTIWDRLRLSSPLRALQNIIAFLLAKVGDSNIKLILVAPILLLLYIPIILITIIISPFKPIAKAMLNPNTDIKVTPKMDETNPEIERFKEIGTFLKSKIIEINDNNPLEAIKHFATTLKNSEVIVVFSKPSLKKIQQLIGKNDKTPTDLIAVLKNLELNLPASTNYEDLMQVVDALQLLSLEHVKALGKQHLEELSNRRHSITPQFASKDTAPPQEPDPEAAPENKPNDNTPT